ncbi:MAG: TetR family transcriptional regulator [Bacteroidia bacterium]|nr:TetR family transcriptional regulator [Bacteroidia bacterium]HRG03905.1 TetR family transcriptional regulator [Paludibacteraceae bacterium]
MSLSTSKTRKKLIDVSRELFALRGKKNITMNDIAEASKKGRRTLYTYFKNKDEVYKAVIENELNLVIIALEENAKKAIDAFEKLRNHIIIHLDLIKQSVTRNGTLRADFFKDIYEVERSRRKMDVIELKIIRNILDEGLATGKFKTMDTEIASSIIMYSLKGLEIPYIRQNLTSEFEKNKHEIVEFVFNGISMES